MEQWENKKETSLIFHLGVKLPDITIIYAPKRGVKWLLGGGKKSKISE